MFLNSRFSTSVLSILYCASTSSEDPSPASANSTKISRSLRWLSTDLKASVHCFLSLILRRCASAFVGLSQKLGSKVCSSSSAISASFLSMSKIPPQGLYTAPYILKLLSIHAAKIRLNFGCGLYTLFFYIKLLNSRALDDI